MLTLEEEQAVHETQLVRPEPDFLIRRQNDRRLFLPLTREADAIVAAHPEWEEGYVLAVYAGDAVILLDEIFDAGPRIF